VDAVEIFESVPNFSEGRDRGVIDAIAEAARAARLLDVDPDEDHHRVVVSLAGLRKELIDALLGTVAVAAERIDLRRHSGVHPRVGAADVVPIIPLGDDVSLDACHEVARELGQRIWTELRIPVFFYGHGEDWTLADVRAGRAQPDLGGPDLHPTAGAVCVGARRPLIAFNVVLPRTSIPDARSLARAIRERASGIRGVQALVFELSGGRVQLSMNLFRTDETTPADVVKELERRGVEVGEQEIVGLCPAGAANAAAAGRLLEAHVAAAVALEAVQRCLALGDSEHAALASRLQQEGADMALLGVTQEELLGGAERAAALTPVLKAAGVLDGELRQMARIAAAGLRDALSPETKAAFPARAAALERRVDRSA
jgi:glutamate formiminotransferase